MTSGPAFLGELRDRLLDQVLGLLKADPAVAGVALIGSLGRGEADNWSDIDLLILMATSPAPDSQISPPPRPGPKPNGYRTADITHGMLRRGQILGAPSGRRESNPRPSPRPRPR